MEIDGIQAGLWSRQGGAKDHTMRGRPLVGLRRGVHHLPGSNASCSYSKGLGVPQ